MIAPAFRVEIGYGATWQTEPGDISWVDETSRVLVSQGVACTRGASSVRGGVDTGELEFVLRNEDRRFDPTYADGPLYGQLVPGVPVRVVAAVLDPVTDEGSVVYDHYEPVWDSLTEVTVWSGTIPSWPQRYDVGNKAAFVPVRAYDRFDKLSRAKIPRSVIEREILADDPQAYWPLDEASGSVMRDRSGNRHDGWYSPRTTALSEEVRPADDAPAVRGLGLDGNHKGHASDLALCILTPPMAIEMVIVAGTAAVGGSETVAYRAGTGNPSQGAVLQFWTPGGYIIGARGIVTDGAYSGSTDPAVDFTEPTHVVLRVTPGPVQQIFINGAEITPRSTIDLGNPVAIPGVSIGGASNAYGEQAFRGFVGQVAQYTTDLDDTRIAAHAQAVFAPLAGQRTDERIDWILDEIGWPIGLRVLSPGRTRLGPATFVPGDGALGYLRMVADTEDGTLFTAADGSLSFHDRYWRYLEPQATISQVTFTDQPGGGMCYAEFELDLDDELLVNVARYARRDGVEQVATDPASIAVHGEAEDRKSDLLLRTDSEVRSRAEWAVATKSTPLPRIPHIRIPLHAYTPAAQAAVLALDLDHRVTCQRTPQGIGDPIELDFLIRGIRHEVGVAEWWTTLYVEPVPQDTVNLFILSESVLSGPDILAH